MKLNKTYKIIKNNANCDYSIISNFEEINVRDSKITNPTLLCFGGNQTKSTFQAEAYANIAKSIAGLYPDSIMASDSFVDIDILSLCYGETEEGGEYNTPTFLSIEEIEEIGHYMLEPLMLDDSGNPLNVDDAMRNFNQLTIFTHCYGSVVVNSLVMYIQDVMTNKYNYSDEDVKKILGEVTCIAYAPYNPTHIIPTFEIKTFEDFTVMDWLKCGLYKKGVNGLKFVQSNDNTLTLWSSRLANGDDQEKDPLVDKLFKAAEKINGIKVKYDEHSPVIINRNNQWQLSTKEGSHYAGCNADAASQVVGYTLASSLANSIQNKFSKGFRPKPSLEEVRAVGLDIISSFNAEDLMYKDDF